MAVLGEVVRRHHLREAAGLPASLDAADWLVLAAMLAIPPIVWLCWRALLWIVAGFTPERARNV